MLTVVLWLSADNCQRYAGLDTHYDCLLTTVSVMLRLTTQIVVIVCWQLLVFCWGWQHKVLWLSVNNFYAGVDKTKCYDCLLTTVMLGLTTQSAVIVCWQFCWGCLVWSRLTLFGSRADLISSTGTGHGQVASLEAWSSIIQYLLRPSGFEVQNAFACGIEICLIGRRDIRCNIDLSVCQIN